MVRSPSHGFLDLFDLDAFEEGEQGVGCFGPSPALVSDAKSTAKCPSSFPFPSLPLSGQAVLGGWIRRGWWVCSHLCLPLPRHPVPIHFALNYGNSLKDRKRLSRACLLIPPPEGFHSPSGDQISFCLMAGKTEKNQESEQKPTIPLLSESYCDHFHHWCLCRPQIFLGVFHLGDFFFFFLIRGENTLHNPRFSPPAVLP